MRYYKRFLFTIKGVNNATVKTGKIKGHYLNNIAATKDM